MEAWKGNEAAKFVYQCKLFTDGLIMSPDPKVIHMLYIQGVYNTITSLYPTTDKEAVTLAALQFQARFGGHNPSTHKVGFLHDSLTEYIPNLHLNARGASAKTPAQWEEAIFHKHAFSTTETPRESYLQVLSKRDYYGAVLFAVKQK